MNHEGMNRETISREGVETVFDLQDLSALIGSEAEALGMMIVRIAFCGGQSDPVLQVMAERLQTRQMTIEDCVALSRRVSARLDALEEKHPTIERSYRLEISSPGIDRPLTRPADFLDWAGHEAKISLSEKSAKQRRFRGILSGFDSKSATVGIIDRNGTTHTVPFDLVESAELILTDRLIAATSPLCAAEADELEEADQRKEEG